MTKAKTMTYKFLRTPTLCLNRYETDDYNKRLKLLSKSPDKNWAPQIPETFVIECRLHVTERSKENLSHNFHFLFCLRSTISLKRQHECASQFAIVWMTLECPAISSPTYIQRHETCHCHSHFSSKCAQWNPLLDIYFFFYTFVMSHYTQHSLIVCARRPSRHRLPTNRTNEIYFFWNAFSQIYDRVTK